MKITELISALEVAFQHQGDIEIFTGILARNDKKVVYLDCQPIGGVSYDQQHNHMIVMAQTALNAAYDTCKRNGKEMKQVLIMPKPRGSN